MLFAGKSEPSITKRVAPKGLGLSLLLALIACGGCRTPKEDGKGAPTASATGAVRVASPFCTEPRKAVANEKSCSDCEVRLCEPQVAKGCDNFAEPEKQEQCRAALRCMRSTNCAAQGGALECYCGPGVDIMSCRADKANAKGACKSDIIRGYPPDATADFIVMHSTFTDVPAAAALALSQCDYVFCGPPELNGHNECLPYCN